MEPAAALRGFANGGSPAAARSSFSFANPARERYTSPSAMRSTGRGSASGTEAIVRMLCVTSSPVTPSPRVAAVTSVPFSYVRTIFNPSIFGSRSYDTGSPASFSTRAWKARTSSSVNASLKDHCATAWRTFVSSGSASPTMRRVTEAGCASAG